MASAFAGVTVGAVVVALIQLRADSVAPQDGPWSGSNDRGSGTAAGVSASTAVGPFSRLVYDYATVAGLADPAALASRFEDVLHEPPSYARTRGLEVLAARLFEVDRSYAAAIAARQDLPQRLLASFFRTWARIDVEAAIDLLDELRDPARLRLAALAMIEAVGPDAIDRIAREVPALEVESLRLAAFIQRAGSDPSAALRGVLESTAGSADRERAIADVGRIAASVDPRAAAAAVSSIPGAALQRAYLTAVYERWALADVPQLLNHLGALQVDQLALLLEGTLPRAGTNVTATSASLARAQGLPLPLIHALALAAESDPARVLEFGREVGDSLGLLAEAAALEAIAATDPATATAYLDAVPDGFHRDVLTVSIAEGYARQDPDSALSWAKALAPPNERAERVVMTALAAADFSKALSLELANLDTRQGAVINSPAIPAWFANGLEAALDDAAGIIEQILAADENGLWEERMLTTVLSRWAESDADAAIAWVQANSELVSGEALEAVVEQLGNLDVGQKLALAELVPPERRGAVIRNAFADLADQSTALAMAEQYRGQPFYNSLVITTVSRITLLRGPREAARLVGTSPSTTVAVAVAGTWAETEPLEAAAWASSLATAEARAEAVFQIVDRWARQDAAAAARWVRSLSDAEIRDRAIAIICRRFPVGPDCG